MSQSAQNTTATIIAQAASARENLIMPFTDGAKLQLDFDQNEASISRVDNDLVFSFDNGGQVIISKFFVTNGEELPILVLQDGTEVPSHDILAALNPDMDLTTAAGEGTSSGVSSYADDPGTLISGLGEDSPSARAGKLGTWDKSSSTPYSTYFAMEEPRADFNISLESGPGGSVGMFAGMHEDGKPNQYQQGHDAETVYGRINFSFNPSGSTVVENVALTGFTAGTKIYMGDPTTTEPIVISDPTQPVYFTHEQLDSGVFILPPADSDKDMNITIYVDIRSESSGITDTLTGSSTFVVDAVADLPENLKVAAAADITAHHMSESKQTSEEFTADGFHKTTTTVTTNTQEGSIALTFTVQVTFGDYKDGSEKHFVLVEAKEGFTANYETVEHNGTTYYKVPVSTSEIAKGNGTVTVDVTLNTKEVNADTEYNFKTGAMAEETASDRDLSGDNDKAFAIQENTPVKVDVVGSTLTVKAGWASEGNNDAKHLGETSDKYEYTGKEGAAHTDSGAPITISISGDANASSSEYITTVTFTFDASRGELVYDGPGTLTNNGDGTWTLDLTGQKVTSVEGLHFKPTNTGMEQYNDADVEMDYTVTVKNEAGASATYTGKSTVVIDAVADKPTDINTDVAYDDKGEYTAADWGSKVSITVTATFKDLDGSEKHYLLLEAREGWDNPNGYPVVEHGGKQYFYVEVPSEGVVDNGNGSYSFKLK